MSTKKNLRIIFDRGAMLDGSKSFDRQFRFVPRGFGLPNSTGWGVWDQKQNRFLNDREVGRLSIAQLDERWTQ